MARRGQQTLESPHGKFVLALNSDRVNPLHKIFGPSYSTVEDGP
jgi:hypothetical protein